MNDYAHALLLWWTITLLFGLVASVEYALCRNSYRFKYRPLTWRRYLRISFFGAMWRVLFWMGVIGSVGFIFSN